MDIWLPLAGGLILLLAGGEFLVRGAVNIATRLGVSPLVIGLTLVGFGTSTPELVTSVQAALSASPGIAYGNIVGSNIANILLILGISALLAPIAVASSALRRDGIVMVAVAVIFAAAAAIMPLGQIVGLAFLAALALYVYVAFRQERNAAPPEHGAAYDKGLALQEADPALPTPGGPPRPFVIALLTALGGLALVVVGGGFLGCGLINSAAKV